jgi:hypothetical protein
MFFEGGGDEADPAFGRLGSAESVAKPTARTIFFVENQRENNLCYVTVM